MPNRRGHKLRNIAFHELLGHIRHLREPFITPFIIPFDDLDAWPALSLSLNPFSDLFVGSTGSDKILKVGGGNFCKSEKEVIERTVKVVLAGGSGECRATLVQGPGRDDITPQRLARAAWVIS